MKVWVASSGMYAEEFISGVYATAEAAMQAHPIPENAKPMTGGIGWQRKVSADGEVSWHNGCDHSNHVCITELEIESEDGPLDPIPLWRPGAPPPPDHALKVGERQMVEGNYNMDCEGWPVLIGGHGLAEFVDTSRGAEGAVYRVTIERVE